MAYPKLTIHAANLMFQAIGIEIFQHELGYYEAIGILNEHEQPFRETRLIALTHDILTYITNQEKNK